jgi:hypothetical protein
MEPKDSHDEKQPRTIKAAPFAWQHKDMLRMITDTFSESDQAASARSLYVALTELASDNQSETFTATKALIAHKAGLSVSTVQRLLKGLEQLGVILIQPGRINGLLRTANTYTLLPIGHSDSSIGRGRSRSNPDKVEKNRKKKNKEERVVFHESSKTTRSIFSPKVRYPDSEEEMVEMLEKLGIEPVPDYDGNFFEQMQASDWTIRGEPIWDWPAVYKARLEVTFPAMEYENENHTIPDPPSELTEGHGPI